MGKAVRRCADNPAAPEYSLCGQAYDAFDSGDADERFEFVEKGQTINCENCCRAIREIKRIRNPIKPRSEWLKARHLEIAAKERDQ